MKKKTANIEEELNFREEYFVLGKELCDRILVNSDLPFRQVVIAVGGESGCGKSTTAVCLEREFIQNGITCNTLHMDSYFKLPPKDNHKNRVKSLKNVGPQEINMSLINQHIAAFKNGKEKITIPVVNYVENSFSEKELDLADVEVLIVEGVYSFLLENINHKIFLSRTYHDTFQNRLKRTREDHEPLIELILEIEHSIVSPMLYEADFVIEKNYTVK